MKPQPFVDKSGVMRWRDFAWFHGASMPDIASEAPYKVGMTLWVRETFRLAHKTESVAQLIYRADDPEVWGAKWKPSIFMPRRFSRIDLEITYVRCQRLQDITEEDAVAEGIGRWERSESDPCSDYAVLWDSINPQAPWASNPFVFAYTFRRVRP
jgi:hypothetical protein